MIEPPFSNEAETAVIASLITDSSLTSKVSFLSSDDFYRLPHRLIYKLIESERDKGNDFDLYTIGDRITDDMGGLAYLADIMGANATTRNVVAYARRVIDMSIRRKAMEAYSNAMQGLSDLNCDLVDELAKASSDVDSQLTRLSLGDVLTVDDLIGKSVEEMESSLEDARLGVSTGIPEIDDRLGYRQLAVGEVTYLGAQSKNGKTLFANTIAARCELLQDEVCHIFSVEMPAIGMFNGIVSAMSGVPSNFYARQSYYSQHMPERYSEWMNRWGHEAQQLNESQRVTIDDKKDVTMAYICSEMRKQKQLLANKGKTLRLVIIDHLHRLSFNTKEKPMTYAMGDDVRMLKNTAADLGIAVLLLGQLNESCKDKNPTAFDILDTSRVRHEIQCFIGTRIFRSNGGTFFGIYSDAHRYADHETVFAAGYVKMVGGIVRSLDTGETFSPNQES